jgi:hypothetical protein
MTGFERTTAPVTRTQIVRFAGAAGDFNPMHHDEPFAQATGQPSVFAMGQLTAAIVGSAVAGWLGRENVAAYGVRFKHNVCLAIGWYCARSQRVIAGSSRHAARTTTRFVLTGWARLQDGTA